MNLNENQQAAIVHLDSERLRYARMAKRLRVLRMNLLASVCDDFAGKLKNAMELQIRVLNNDASLIFTDKSNTTDTSPQ